MQTRSEKPWCRNNRVNKYQKQHITRPNDYAGVPVKYLSEMTKKNMIYFFYFPIVLFQAAKSANQSIASATNHHQVNITWDFYRVNTKRTNSNSRRFSHGGRILRKEKPFPFWQAINIFRGMKKNKSIFRADLELTISTSSFCLSSHIYQISSLFSKSSMNSFFSGLSPDEFETVNLRI